MNTVAGRGTRATARRTISGLAIAAALAGSAAAGTTARAAPSAASDLQLALSFMPSGAGASYMFEFADWATIEASLGFATPQLGAEKNLGAFSDQLDRLASVPSGNTTYDLGTGGKLWTAADVTWDAIELPVHGGPPLSLTGLSPGFALAGIGRYLSHCGFKVQTVDGLPVYGANTATALNCAGPFGADIPSPVNDLAIDAPDHLVLMATSPASLAAGLADRRTRRGDPVATALLGPLGSDPAVALSVGPQWCSELSNPVVLAGRTATPEVIASAERVYSDHTPYLGFGIGETISRATASGQIAFDYASPQSAQTDLTAREHVLTHGLSFISDLPYSKLLQLTAGHASGSTAVLDVGQPAGGHPLALGDMFNRLDLGFARC